jgi:poly-beta-1,6-N-acetyl-D-glucosamine synthase
MKFALEIVLYGSIAVLGYTYLVYPLLLAVWARYGKIPVHKAEATPSVTVVIAVWNEALRIKDRLADCLAQDYPEQCLNIVVVSDGSTDGSAEVVKSIGSSRIKLLALEKRMGKAVALNHGMMVADGEIVVYTDARQKFSPTAVRELVQNFIDPTVGAVTGELVLEESIDKRGNSHAGGLYWKVEKWIRKNEGAIDSVIGATGAIYAIRRSLYRSLPPGTILDDLLTPMQIAMRGQRVVFEDRALAYDVVPSNYKAEFSRKVRTLAGNYQAISLCPGLLLPWRNRLFFQFISHKICRLIAPLCMILLLLANFWLRSGWLELLLLAQIAGYGLALIGWGFRTIGIHDRWTGPAFTFCMLNVAAMLGAIQFFRSRAIAWEKAT